MRPQAPRYLLVGGSNCVIKDGFGAKLQEKIPGEWVNRSLGNSSSLRGIQYLLSHSKTWCDFDLIFFEYTLNDLIFEVSQTLDPIAHLNWLRALLRYKALRRRLVFLHLHGQSASQRLSTGHSFVSANYHQVAEEFGARSINLFPVISVQIATSGPDAVFKDSDHFSDAVIEALVAATAAEMPQSLGDDSQPMLVEENSYRVITVDTLTAAKHENVLAVDFNTALVKTRLIELREGSCLRINSPGGSLVGIYALASQEAGCVEISHKDRQYVKSLRHRFKGAKPFLALRHFSTPIPTVKHDEIVIRHVPDIYASRQATLDHTMAQVINAKGNCIQVGPLVFLRNDTI